MVLKIKYLSKYSKILKVIFVLFAVLLLFFAYIYTKKLFVPNDITLNGCVDKNSFSWLSQKNNLLKNDPLNQEPQKIELKPSLKDSNVALFTYHELLGGGYYSKHPFFEYQDNICPFNETNAQAIFVPINNPKKALDYYMIVNQEIGGAHSDVITYLYQVEDYDLERVTTQLSLLCRSEYKAKLNNQVSQVNSLNEGYSLKLIGFDPIMNEFFENNALVTEDGKISESSKKTLFSCGAPFVF